LNFPFRLSENKKFDGVGFGLNAVDHLIVVPSYPEFDTKTRLLDHVQTAGGQTATAMAALQRLGFKTAYAGRFGSDAEGTFGFNALKDEGVDMSHAQVVPGARNQIAFIMVEQRTGERTIIWDRDDRLAYRAADAPVEFAELGRVLHIDAHDPPACTRLAKRARETGTIVSADIDNIYNGLPELLPLIDILIVSKEFPQRLTGITDERQSLIELKRRFGCPVIGMTLGQQGSIACGEEQFIRSPAFAVPGACRDTTGAGDAFRGGFLYGLLTGADLENSLRFGNAVAALKCRELGARTALPRRPELEEFLRSARTI